MQRKNSLTVHTRSLILATGATQPKARLQREFVAGVPVVERWGDRLMQSGDVIGFGGLARVAEQLQGKAQSQGGDPGWLNQRHGRGPCTPASHARACSSVKVA